MHSQVCGASSTTLGSQTGPRSSGARLKTSTPWWTSTCLAASGPPSLSCPWSVLLKVRNHSHKLLTSHPCFRVDKNKCFLSLSTGRIIFVSSIFAFFNCLNMGAYSVSKRGLEAFSDCLRVEMASFDVKVRSQLLP